MKTSWQLCHRTYSLVYTSIGLFMHIKQPDKQNKNKQLNFKRQQMRRNHKTCFVYYLYMSMLACKLTILETLLCCLCHFQTVDMVPSPSVRLQYGDWMTLLSDALMLNLSFTRVVYLWMYVMIIWRYSGFLVSVPIKRIRKIGIFFGFSLSPWISPLFTCLLLLFVSNTLHLYFIVHSAI